MCNHVCCIECVTDLIVVHAFACMLHLIVSTLSIPSCERYLYLSTLSYWTSVLCHTQTTTTPHDVGVQDVEELRVRFGSPRDGVMRPPELSFRCFLQPEHCMSPHRAKGKHLTGLRVNTSVLSFAAFKSKITSPAMNQYHMSNAI